MPKYLHESWIKLNSSSHPLYSQIRPVAEPESISQRILSPPLLQTCQLSVLENPLLCEFISLFSQMKSKYVFSINTCNPCILLIHISAHLMLVCKTLLENHHKCSKNPQNFNLSRLALEVMFSQPIWRVLLWCRLTCLHARGCPD